MKKNRRKKNKSGHAPPAREEAVVISFREQLKSENPEVRDAALQLLRQADMVTVFDSKKPRGLLIVADKVKENSDGKVTIFMEGKNVVVQVDEEQSEELVDESAQQIEELHTLLEKAKGPWKFFGNVQDPDDPDQEPRFMFTRNGAIQEIDIGVRRGPVFAYTRQMAKLYVGGFEETKGIKLGIADIQAVGRQLFGSVLVQASMNGANCYFVINPADHGNAEITSVPLKGSFHMVDGWIAPTTDTELPQYMFTLDEQIVCYDVGNKHGPFLAYTGEVAERFAAEMERRKGVKAEVTDILADTDMTVAELLNQMAEDAANCACVVRSVADDGKPKWDFIYPVNLPAE